MKKNVTVTRSLGLGFSMYLCQDVDWPCFVHLQHFTVLCADQNVSVTEDDSSDRRQVSYQRATGSRSQRGPFDGVRLQTSLERVVPQTDDPILTAGYKALPIRSLVHNVCRIDRCL